MSHGYRSGSVGGRDEQPEPASQPLSRQVATGLSAHGPNASDPVRDVVAAVAGLCDEALSGDLIAGASIADSVVVLARVSHVLSFELARRLTTASGSGALRHTPRVTLTDAGGLSGPDAAALVAAAGFADQHPDLAQAWRAGRIATDTVAVIARGLRPIPVAEQAEVVTAVLPHLRTLSRKALRRFIATAVDVLTPDQPEVTEQRRHARRYLAFSHYAGMTAHPCRPTRHRRRCGAGRDPSLGRITAGRGRRSDPWATPCGRTDDPDQRRRRPRRPACLHERTPRGSVGHDQPHRSRTPHHPPPPPRDNDGEGTRDPVLLTGSDVTLGDAATRFALCTGSLTGILTHHEPRSSTAPGSTGLSGIAARLAGTRIQPLALGRSTRLATTAQRTALALRDGGCVIPGCGRPPSECQTHHVTDWAHGGRTDLDSLASLCWVHHRQVDLHKWRLTRNPDPHGPHWTVTPIRRHAWRKRRAE